MRFLSKLIFLLWFTPMFLVSCERQADNELVAGHLPPDFIEFYTLFHHDTAFQAEHIVFPLQGKRMQTSDTSSLPDYWTREEWTPHGKFNAGDKFTRTYDILEETMIVETIRQRDGLSAMQRRFAKLSDGWHLIYYVEMQPIEATSKSGG